jgi:transposase
MSESLCIDSALRGLAMPKAYSCDLRERVIEAVETGASRREAAERFEVSVASAVKWLQRWRKKRSAAPEPRGGSISPLDEFAVEVLALIAEQPDMTLIEVVAELRKRRIKTSRSSLWRFLDRHNITLKKKACKLPNGSEQMWCARADVGFESKACLIPPGWCLSMRRRSAPTWCGSRGGLHGASG